jgi:predicted small integral membrane protein
MTPVQAGTILAEVAVMLIAIATWIETVPGRSSVRGLFTMAPGSWTRVIVSVLAGRVASTMTLGLAMT